MSTQNLERILGPLGLEMVSDPKWLNLEAGPGYLCSFYRIGQNIVYSTGKNDMRFYRAADFFSTLDAFVSEESVSVPFILIRDMAEAKGIVTSTERVGQVSMMKKRVGIIGACVYCNCGFLVSNIIRLAGLGYGKIMGFHVTRDSEAAVRKALEIIGSDPRFKASKTPPARAGHFSGTGGEGSGELRLDMVEFQPDLEYKNPDSGFSYRTGFIEGRLLFSALSGQVTDRDLASIAPLMSEILTRGKLDGKTYHRVADYSGLGSISIFHQKKYAQIIKEIHQRHNCQVTLNYICGASSFLRGALRIFSGFVNQRMLFADTVEQAFDEVRKSEAGKADIGTHTIRKADIDGLIEMLGGFLFDSDPELTAGKMPFPPDHPLYPVAEAFTIVREDLHQIKTREETVRQELKASENELLSIQNLRRLGTLAGGIAHDFNNILTGIFGNLSMLRKCLGNDHPGLKFLDRAGNSLERASRMTGQLLVFSKGGVPTKEKLMLDQIVKEVAIFDLSGSSVKPLFEIPGGLWPVEADKGQMQQVFSNLIINAVDSMPEGGRLTIVMENVILNQWQEEKGLTPGKYVKTEVRDEGTGIDPTHAGLIFDPYFTTKKTGSGLGLATVFSIVCNHGGMVKADSGPGGGTIFTVLLPACEAAEQPRPDQDPATPSIEYRPDGPRNVLVMDDDEVILEFAIEALESEGYRVAAAKDGQQAVDIYEKAFISGEPFDMVVMDLTIPGGMGGMEAMAALLRIDPGVRVVVSSGYTEDEVIARYSQYGFKGFLAKPYTAERLIEKLTSNL